MAPKKVTPRGKGASGPKASPRATGKKQAKRAPAKKGPTQRYIRALYAPAGGTRITLNNESRFHLQPRGQVNDLAPVSEEDMSDPVYVQNVGVLFEEVSEAEAKKIIKAQATNAQAPRDRGAIQHITNELGQPIDKVTTEQSFESQGEVVAHISDGPAGRYTDGYQGTITRAPGAPPTQVDAPGSAGNPIEAIASLTPDQLAELRALPPEQQADYLARKTEGGALETLRSRVGPVRREQ